MTEDPTPRTDWPDRRAELKARRGEQRRRLRRRRIVAATALVAVCAALVAVLADGGNGTPPLHEAGAPATRSSQSSRAPAPVRNATPQPDWAPHTGPVPILEYHVLGAAPPGTAYPDLFVGRADFSREMDWLDRNGYQAVTLEAVERAWNRGGTLPAKPVVLSFDDGYRPQFTFALPELRKHGWPGLLNLKAEGSDLYTSNVEAMIDAGWELAAHTTHHLDLTTLDPSQLQEEVAGSRAILKREYDVPVENFCYPAGRFNEAVIEAVEAAGYTGATTEIPGEAERQKPYELSRFEILRSSGVEGVAEDLRAGAQGLSR